MMYLSIVIYNIAVLAFTAYMVIHVHPVWAFCILLIQRIVLRMVHVESCEDEDEDAEDDVYGMDWSKDDDCNDSSRNEF